MAVTFPPEELLQTLREREAYLKERVKAKKTVGWEYTYDEREQIALAWAICELSDLLADEDDGA